MALAAEAQLPPLDPRNLRCDKDAARNWPDNVERAAPREQLNGKRRICRID
jgi:hypothetical protein